MTLIVLRFPILASDGNFYHALSMGKVVHHSFKINSQKKIFAGQTKISKSWREQNKILFQAHVRREPLFLCHLQKFQDFFVAWPLIPVLFKSSLCPTYHASSMIQIIAPFHFIQAMAGARLLIYGELAAVLSTRKYSKIIAFDEFSHSICSLNNEIIIHELLNNWQRSTMLLYGRLPPPTIMCVHSLR